MVTNAIDSSRVSKPLNSSPTAPLRSRSHKARKKRALPVNNGPTLVYNEYGELVDIEKIKRPPASADLSVTETLRLIRKAYHHEFRKRIADVVSVQIMGDQSPAGENGRLPWKGRLFSWDFIPKPPLDASTEEAHNVRVYKNSLRVLEIGCGDGDWSNKVKSSHPDWIVEGLDDVDHWSKKSPGTIFRDFMGPDNTKQPADTFNSALLTQETVEFTVRNLSTLTSHLIPIPDHSYNFVRARDVFDKVESYKGFLEEVRQILLPEGIVEFVEVDPRPRASIIDRRRSSSHDHTSRPETNWTDRIADRFRDPHDEQLATNVPKWTKRVEERLKATLRPKDGVPAANLKSWLEGAGFWDVKQVVLRLTVGGNSVGGRLLLQSMKQQVDLENQVPMLAANLPPIEFDLISQGNHFINMHVVTARKPKHPRPGDKLIDGMRQEMTVQKYDAMKKLRDGNSNHQWRRFNLDKLSTMMRLMMIVQESTEQGEGERDFTSMTDASDFYLKFQPSERERGGRVSEKSDVEEGGVGDCKGATSGKRLMMGDMNG